jgi:uncharacterized membrane protein
MSNRSEPEHLARIVALVGLLGGAFQIYVYLNPDSAKLSPLAIYSWYFVSVLLVLLGLIVGLPLKKGRKKRRS